MQNAMTIDVEDYFQVSAFENIISPNDWDAINPRVESNVDRLLQMFDENGCKATFFTLGWIAKRFPKMVNRIANEGHEIASHGTMHKRASDQSVSEFEEDVSHAKKLLEDISGKAVLGYRAPSFSFTKDNLWVYEVLAKLGYVYSSSVYPVVHDHYGIPDAPRFKYVTDAGIDEIPLSTLPMFGKNWPISGGGYFRLYPYSFTKWAVSKFSRNEKKPYIFYMHPWELDPDQPRIAEINAKTRFRHYLNLSRVDNRLNRLLGDFQWSSMSDVFGYGG